MVRAYEYRGRDCSGLPCEGIITAENETAVAAILRSKGYLITRISVKRTSLLQRELILFGKEISSADLAIFARQFSVMIDAGMPLVSVLKVLAEQTERKQLKDAVRIVLNDVQSGDTLAGAMGKHPRVFPAIVVNLVEAGELGGMLNEVMDRLAEYLEKEHKLIENIKGAMTYPLVIVMVTALVVSGIITFILPTFEQLFKNAKMELPLPTQFWLALSGLFRHHYLAVGGGVATAVFGGRKLLSLPVCRPFIDSWKLRLPVWGDISKKAAVARLCRILSTLLRGGVNILPALDVVKKVAGNHVIETIVSKAQISVKEGCGLSSPFLASGVFPPMAAHMIAIGEETGKLDKMLSKAADFFESEVEGKINNLSKLIEPLLIVLLAALIGFIVISMMLPMFQMSFALY